MSQVRRFDHVGITVADLDAVVALFAAAARASAGSGACAACAWRRRSWCGSPQSLPASRVRTRLRSGRATSVGRAIRNHRGQLLRGVSLVALLTAIPLQASAQSMSQLRAMARRLHVKEVLAKVNAMQTESWTKDDRIDWLLFRAQIEGRWCLDPHEELSPGQMEEIDRVCRAYPHLPDDTFVQEHLDDWLR